MLLHMIQEGKQAATVPELCRVLSEVTAYVMQTGRRGGRYYYDERGNRHYRELTSREKARAGASGASGASASAERRPTREEYDRAWREADIRNSSDIRLPTSTVMLAGRAFRELLGDKAPLPDDVKNMFSAEGITAQLTGISASEASTYGSATVRLGYSVKDQDGTDIGNMTRTFQVKQGKKNVYHAYFALREEAQGGGRAGAMFGKALKTYQKMGIQHAEVGASLSTGPYAWARFGFQPDRYQMESVRDDFRTFLKRDPIKLSDAEVNAVVREFGDDLYTLSEATVRAKRLNPQTGEEELRTVKAGKDFLLHYHGGDPRDWHGVADLEDPKTVQRWENQGAKGTAKRRKAISEGTQNARDTSPAAIAGEIDAAGFSSLARQVRLLTTGGGRGGGSPSSAWDGAIQDIENTAKDSGTRYKSALEKAAAKLKPFQQRAATREQYTRDGMQKFAREQDQAREMLRRRAQPPVRPAAPTAAPAGGTDAFVIAQRADRFGTTPDQEREIERLAARRVNAETTRRRENQRQASRWGDPEPRYTHSIDQFSNEVRRDERRRMQAAAQAAAAAAKRPQPAASVPYQPVTPSPSAAQKQPRPAAPAPAPAPAPTPAPAPVKKEPEPVTPEKRAAKYGTTVSQEKRIDAISQNKQQAELLRRREIRGQAQATGRPVPDFIPIRTYAQRIRALERARLRGR